jgi:hypothetical protein
MKKDSVSNLRNDALIFGRLITEFTKKASSYEVAKKLFNSEVKDDYDLRKKESFMRQWFEKWKELGVIKKETVDGVSYYSLDMSKIKWGNAILRLKCGKKSESINLGFSLAFIIGNSWVVVTI